MPVGMPALRVRHRDPSHDLGQLSVGTWPQQKMPMVRHQTISADAYTGAVIRFGQNIFKCGIIGGLLEQLQPTEAPVQYMIDNPTS